MHVVIFFEKSFEPAFSILIERHAVTLNWYGFHSTCVKTLTFEFSFEKDMLFFF